MLHFARAVPASQQRATHSPRPIPDQTAPLHGSRATADSAPDGKQPCWLRRCAAGGGKGSDRGARGTGGAPPASRRTGVSKNLLRECPSEM